MGESFLAPPPPLSLPTLWLWGRARLLKSCHQFSIYARSSLSRRPYHTAPGWLTAGREGILGSQSQALKDTSQQEGGQDDNF